MKTSELIRNSRNRLFEKGWQQGNAGGSQGPNCIIGALTFESFDLRYGKDVCIDARIRAQSLIASLVSDKKYDCIAKWNDYKFRTFDQVVELLEEAEKVALTREDANVVQELVAK